MDEVLVARLAQQAGFDVSVRHHPPSGILAPQLMEEQARVYRLAELVAEECAKACDATAADADTIAKSKFVTQAGRLLHEGEWGGATNAAASIRAKFGAPT